MHLFDGDGEGGALALVRRGALYLDPGAGDIWFHPWGEEPRVIGHGSEAGPGGDPDGDLAVWSDGPEAVVYDTAAGVRSHAPVTHPCPATPAGPTSRATPSTRCPANVWRGASGRAGRSSAWTLASGETVEVWSTTKPEALPTCTRTSGCVDLEPLDGAADVCVRPSVRTQPEKTKDTGDRRRLGDERREHLLLVYFRWTTVDGKPNHRRFLRSAGPGCGCHTGTDLNRVPLPIGLRARGSESRRPRHSSQTHVSSTA